VVNSATALYRTELGLGRETVRTLSHHMVRLLGLAKKYDIPALITNQIYMDVERDRISGLGGGRRLSTSQRPSSGSKRGIAFGGRCSGSTGPGRRVSRLIL